MPGDLGLLVALVRSLDKAADQVRQAECSLTTHTALTLFTQFSDALGEYLAMLRDMEDRPRIVCLCGSTKFKDEFVKQNARLTMAGKIVLSVGFFHHAEWREISDAEKVALDELHKHKIDLADEVFVINVGGYIGDSTRSEIDYAVAAGKPVEFLECGPGVYAVAAGQVKARALLRQALSWLPKARDSVGPKCHIVAELIGDIETFLGPNDVPPQSSKP